MSEFNITEAVPFQLGYLLGLSKTKRNLDDGDREIILAIRKKLSELSDEPLPEHLSDEPIQRRG